MVIFKGGRLPNDPTKKRIRLAPYLATAAPAQNPPRIDWMSRVREWPMYANDRIGDCVWAAIGHQVQAFTTYGRGSTITIYEGDIVKAYSAVTGYDPRDPSSDQGTVVQEALNYWLKEGVGEHKILAFAEVDHRNRDEVETAVHIFGNLHVGINFPASAMDQFNMNEDWDAVTVDGGPLGGHAIMTGGYDRDAGLYDDVSWGRDVRMTQQFWDRYVDEAWVVISPEWLDASGHTPEGVDLHGLGEEYARLTDQPNPFQGPGPGPVDPPVPADDPDLVADRALAAAVRPWVTSRRVGANRDAQKNIARWLRARNL